MSHLHTDLLKQARHLANREPRRPRQASLRRAISAAYYALFHLLIREATTRLVAIPNLRQRFARGFAHTDMKEASKAFSNPAPQPNQLDILTGGVPIPHEVQRVASAFLELQEQRYEADYNVSATFTRSETNQLVARVEEAFQDWQTIRDDPVAQMYLAALLLWRTWKR
jgi:hypothetical protein